MATAASANAAFSPAAEFFPLPEHAQSARLRQALSELGSDCEFRDGVAPLKTLGIPVAFKTIFFFCCATIVGFEHFDPKGRVFGPFTPGKGQSLVYALKIILNMTLLANMTAHFLVR